MAEQPLQITLSREQQFILFAHILTYLFSLTHRATIPPPKETVEQLQEVAYDLQPWREKQQAPLRLSFSPEAVEALKRMIDTLQAVYGQWAEHDTFPDALHDLMMCRALIEEAEQKDGARTEDR